MSIYKEQILPAINNCRASPSFAEHIEGNNINYTPNNNKRQAQMVTAFSSSVYKSIVIYVLDKDDNVLQFIGQQKSINQKARKFGLIREKLQSDRDINLDNIITNYQITSD